LINYDYSNKSLVNIIYGVGRVAKEVLDVLQLTNIPVHYICHNEDEVINNMKLTSILPEE